MQRTPYHCNSWRCPWCGRHEAAVTFARITEAMAPTATSGGWVFLVVTIDRDGYYSGAPWADAETAYRELGRMSANLRRELARWGTRAGWEATGNRWVATVEAHRSGWPHVNMAVYSPGLADALRASQKARPEGHADKCRCPACRKRVLVTGKLRELVERAGFGRESTAEPIRDTSAVASYVTKLAGNQATGGELAKLTQAPTNAPERFRRLRSGKGFLPPRRKNPDITGTLVRRQYTPDGTVDVVPLHRISDAETQVLAQRACRHEEDLVHEGYRLTSLRRHGHVWAAWLLSQEQPGVVSVVSIRGPPACTLEE